jgi:hypothetical protein
LSLRRHQDAAETMSDRMDEVQQGLQISHELQGLALAVN